MRTSFLAGSAALAFCALAFFPSRHRPSLTAPQVLRSTGTPTRGPLLKVPHVSPAPTPNGDLSEDAWVTLSASTGALVDARGAAMRPYSNARLLWDEQNLYVALYAADEDIRFGGSDVFRLVISVSGRHYSVDIDPQGTQSRAQIVEGADRRLWDPALRIGHDADGSPDDARDDDEEWIIELAVPWVALGLQPKPNTQFGLEISRCDVPHHAEQVCGTWGSGNSGTAVLE